MRRKNNRFSAYQQSMFNKYEIDESYLQTGKQRRACLELLEKIDSNQKLDESSSIEKIASAFQGSALHKKIASCITVTALLATLQTTPAMAMASSGFQPSAGIVSTLELPGEETVILDRDSFLDTVSSSVRQELKSTSLHLVAGKPMISEYEPLEDNGVLIDGDSDVAFCSKQGSRTLTVIDTDLEDWEILRDAVKEGEILLLADDDKPLDAILAKLQEMQEIDCLNIVSHGDSGKLKFNNSVIDSETLETDQDAWTKIFQYMSKDGDIQLFGCNIAKGDEGKAFLDKLAQITGADVAASINPTGAENKGGDWTLEAVSGDVAGNLPFAKDAIGKFLGLLTLPATNPVNPFIFSVSNGTYNLTDKGDTLGNNYFTVSAKEGSLTPPLNIDGSSAYIYSSSVGAAFKIIVTSDGTNLGSFELEDISISYASNEMEYFTDIQIIGYVAGNDDKKYSGTIMVSDGTTVSGTNFPGWNNLNGVMLDSFAISSQNGAIYGTSSFSFNSFSVSNMAAPNKVPTVSNSTKNGTEETTLSFSSADFTGCFNDQDGDSLSKIQIISLPNPTTQGVLKLSDITITANQEINAADLGNMTFVPVANFDGNATFTWKASDGTAYAASAATMTLAMAGQNDAPSITSGDLANFAENGTGTVYTATGTDPDTSDTLTWSISGTDASFFNINSSGIVTFNTPPNYELPADNGGDNIYNFTVTATDGSGLTATKAITVTVTDAIDAPVITSGMTASFAENGTGTIYNATATDEDSATITWSITSEADAANFAIDSSSGALTFASAPNYEAPADIGANNTYEVIVQVSDGSLVTTKTVTVTVTNVNEAPSITSGDSANFAENGTGTVYDADGTDPDAGDTLTWSIGGTDATLFNINSSTGVITFKSAPNFEVPADNGGNNVYDLVVTATDSGTGNLTATQAITVTVTDAVDAPVITSGMTASFAENGTGPVYNATATDEDSATITWSITSGADAAKFAIDSSSGALTFASAPNYESPADIGENNTYEVIVQASDGSLVTTKTVTVTVSNVNESPSITSGDPANFAENGTGTVYDADGTDPDAGDTLTWSIGGTDATLFNINSSTGVITFKNAPNFEAPADNGGNNVYDLVVTATDSGTGNLTATKAIAVTVTNVNDAPSITSGATASFTEGGTGTVYDAEGTDPDSGDVITWSISGTDSALFNIDSGTGVLTFIDAPDFDSPVDSGSDNVYNLTITATDSGTGTLTATKAIAVTVTNINEAPSITSGDPANFAENGTGTVYDAEGTDPDASDTLTWSISGADATLFNINSSTGVITFKNAPNFEAPADNGGNNVYDLVVTATDSGTGNLTATKAIAVTVTNVNDAPSITSGATASFTEGGTGTVYTATGADPDSGDSITWSISGTDAGLFNINNSTGALTFKAVPSFAAPADSDANNTYVLTITASDGTLSASSALTVSVVQQSSSGGGGSSGGGSQPAPTETGTNVIVNGEAQNAGDASTSTTNGQTVTTITVDNTKLEQILEEKGRNATVTIPSTGGADVTVGVLNGQTVKSMEEKEAVLEIRTGSVTYTLPASEINIDSVSAQIGTQVQLKDIKVSVSIAEPLRNTVKIVEDTANKNNYQIIVKPVEFEITCTSGGKTVDVSRFNGYVERTVAIPDGVDPSKVTTGIVLNPDGTFTHVPTVITVINGKYYAKINSLTNSTYSVIYNPVEFADVEKHWAKDSVNNMGARLVVGGIGNENFGPDRDITRAEFAAIMIRALGLKAETVEASFSDVKVSDWYAGYVDTAVSYGIITGYSDGTFGPKDKITREQAMTMIARAMKLTGLYSASTEEEMNTLIATYSDGDYASDYAEAGIAACLKADVVSGKSSSKLAPKDYITRAEVAVIIERMLQKSELI